MGTLSCLGARKISQGGRGSRGSAELGGFSSGPSEPLTPHWNLPPAGPEVLGWQTDAERFEQRQGFGSSYRGGGAPSPASGRAKAGPHPRSGGRGERRHGSPARQRHGSRRLAAKPQREPLGRTSESLPEL